MSNPHLENLKAFQSVLMQMHRLLMTSQRTDVEAQTGKQIQPTEWMQLMLTDPRFAWMKSILTLISDIDALMDNYTVSESELHIIRHDAEKLFMTGDSSADEFFKNYRQVAQKDPDVILYHGQLRNKIQSLPKGNVIEETSKIRRSWHVKSSRMN